MILCLRGHIRNSFQDNKLYELIKQLYQLDNNLEVYIHTWNILQSDVSWRKLDNIIIPVTEEYIKTYFNDMSHLIKHIIIDDDTILTLIGNINGVVCKSQMPMLGWKRYWYGKCYLINYIYNNYNNKEKYIVNCRFDIFSNSNSFNFDNVVDFITNNRGNIYDKNKFISDKVIHGIDNIYIGNITTMYKLVNHMYNHLDDIILEYPLTPCQEFLVYYINDKLFTDMKVKEKECSKSHNKQNYTN